MAKYNGAIVALEETNLPALFYYRHLLKGAEGNPVYYYDEIDKKGIDEHFAEMCASDLIEVALLDIEATLTEVRSTVYHGFEYIAVHENIKDEGLAKKHVQTINKMIKNHEAPYNNIFKKYSTHAYNG